MSFSCPVASLFDELLCLESVSHIHEIPIQEIFLFLCQILHVGHNMPYIIENVDGAPLVNPIALYGSQFKNLYTQRKRLFDPYNLKSCPMIPLSCSSCFAEKV
mgnify:CR=1 FL=1